MMRRCSGTGGGCCAKWPMTVVSPTSLLPVASGSAPVSMRTSVVLPLPLGPQMPIRSPFENSYVKSLHEETRVSSCLGSAHRRRPGTLDVSLMRCIDWKTVDRMTLCVRRLSWRQDRAQPSASVHELVQYAAIGCATSLAGLYAAGPSQELS